jgi:hypothetical protein
VARLYVGLLLLLLQEVCVDWDKLPMLVFLLA